MSDNQPIRVLQWSISGGGTLLRMMVFLGDVPVPVRKALHAVMTAFNGGRALPKLHPALKKFYGKSCYALLGVSKYNLGSLLEVPAVLGGGDTGDSAADMFLMRASDLLEEAQEMDEAECYVGGEEEPLEEEPLAEDIGVEIGAEEPPLDEPLLDDLVLDESLLDEMGELRITDNDLVPEVELSDVRARVRAPRRTPASDVLQFVYDDLATINEIDNVLELKKKLFLVNGVPIYRQHIWYHNKHDRVRPAEYIMTMGRRIQNIDITPLVHYFQRRDIVEGGAEVTQPKFDTPVRDAVGAPNALAEMAGVPINLMMYRNKDSLSVRALDAFTLLREHRTQHGVMEYHMTDMEDMLQPQQSARLLQDRYQLELVYYGFVLLYFPMITMSVFADYLRRPRDFLTLYPDLAEAAQPLGERTRAETKITNSALAAAVREGRSPLSNSTGVVSSLLMQSRSKNAAPVSLTNSITATTVMQYSSTKYSLERIHLRNLFDQLELSEQLPQCEVRLMHHNGTVGTQMVHLKKHFKGHAVGGVKSGMQRNTVRVPRDAAMLSLTNTAASDLRLIVYRNGNYHVKSAWREEQQMDFERLIKVIRPAVNQVLRRLNLMGDLIFNDEWRLPLLDDRQVSFSDTNISFYYSKDTTAHQFSRVHHHAEDLRRAGILEMKSVDKHLLEYYMIKGTHVYDELRLERTMSVNNDYEYLSNAAMKQIWRASFDKTRSMRIQYVASKVRVEISGIRNETEMALFYMYLSEIFHMYENDSARRHTSSSGATTSAQHAQATIARKQDNVLRTLKITDPELFNIAQHAAPGTRPVVYSKVCQRTNQPVPLSESEYESLGAEEKSRAVLFWNFTRNHPIRYSCPDSRFPHIKFITGKHPKGYCIPCCKKTPIDEGVNQTRREIHQTCLTDYRYDKDPVSLTQGSSYIMTYGKYLEEGRLARLPEQSLEPLFFDTYSGESKQMDSECVTASGHYLYGVEQNTKYVGRLGYLFCIQHALNIGMDDLIGAMTVALKTHPGRFQTLLRGEIVRYFPTAADMSQRLTRLFVRWEEPILEDQDVPWNELFMDVAYHYLQVNTILFDDPKQDANMVLQLRARVDSADEVFVDGHRNLIVVRRGDLYNPVYLLNTEVYKKSGILVRRLFPNSDNIVSIIRGVISHRLNRVNGGDTEEVITLNTIIRFTLSSVEYEIHQLLVNRSNQCYAVLLRNTAGTRGDLCYFPVHSSHYQTGTHEVNTQPFVAAEHSVRFDRTLQCCAAYNKWVFQVSKAQKMRNDEFDANTDPPHERVIPAFPWVLPNVVLEYRPQGKSGAGADRNMVIGFVANGVNFYHQGVPISVVAKAAATTDTAYILSTWKKNSHVKQLLHHPQVLNRIIHRQSRAVADRRTRRAGAYLYQHHMYQLLVMEFSRYFNRDKNHATRRVLRRELEKSDLFHHPQQLSDVINKVHLRGTEDSHRIWRLVESFVGEHSDRSRLLREFDETHFDFDRMRLERLKKMKSKQLRVALSKLVREFVSVGPLPSALGGHFSNMLVGCTQGTSSPQCRGRRMIVPSSRLNSMLDILTQDILDPVKQRQLFSPVLLCKTSSMFRFVRRPFEHISISIE